MKDWKHIDTSEKVNWKEPVLEGLAFVVALYLLMVVILIASY